MDFYLNLKWVYIIGIVLIIAGCGDNEKKPPGPGTVATYVNGKISIEDLESYLEQRTRGSEVLAGDSLMVLKDKFPKDKKIYGGLIREMVLDAMVKRKITEKQLDNRSNIRHALKHLEDELTLQQLHSEMHEKDRVPVDELDIQQYYDQNRSSFGDKSLFEVREEIKQILASQKEGDYVAGYIGELKDAATITRNYDILHVPEPSDDEIWETHEKNKETYKESEKWLIEQIEIADTTAAVKEKAQKAWAKLGSGESFEAVAAEFGRDSSFININFVFGMRGQAFDKAISSLNQGEYSKPIQEKGKYFIARLKGKIPASYISFEMVKGVIRRTMMDEREKKLYEENKNKTLFTLHGRRFSLGDFYQEFNEMPPGEQEKHRTYEQRVKLVDSMIERLLLLEDSYDRMLNAQSKEEIEHVREDILKKTLHREEVDQKLEVSDEEVKEFYEENKEQFQPPPLVKISIIVVRRGNDEIADKKTKQKIDEAYAKLQSGFFKKGLPFEEVARIYSEDSRSAQNGGQLDVWFGESGNPLYEMINHLFHQQFIDLEEGEITEPFSVGHDYLIVKVRERQEPQQRPFEEVKEHLKEDLKHKEHDELTSMMYNDMIEQANLVVYDQVLDSLINKQEEVSKQ